MELKPILVACALVGIPFAMPQAAAECQWDEPTHVYGPLVFGNIVVNAGSVIKGRGPPIASDTCTDPYNGYAFGGDGDPETGVLSGQFPAYQACLDAHHPARRTGLVHPNLAHHGAYDGAAYTATQDAPWATLGLIVLAGIDGEEIEGTCISDGVIDETNPVDCGSGTVGSGIGAATGDIAANSPLLDPFTGEVLKSADCSRPADGTAWVHLYVGPVFTRPDGPILVIHPFTPLDGCIEDLLTGDPVGIPALPDCIDMAWSPAIPEFHPENLPNTNPFLAIPVTGTIEQTA